MPNKKVLLVDDEVAVRNLFQLSLEREGMLVVSASGKTEALRSIKAWPFDAAVVDLHLLDGDGLDLVREIRARNGNIKLFAMSGYTFDPELLEDLRARQVQVYRKYEPLARLISLLNSE